MTNLQEIIKKEEEEFDNLYSKNKDKFKGNLLPQDKAFILSFIQSHNAKIIEAVCEEMKDKRNRQMKLNYDLKKTNTSDKETLKHFITALESIFDEKSYREEGGDRRGAIIWHNKAIRELKAYMKEFLLQNNIKK